MVSPSDLKPDRVIRAFERAGWENLGRMGKHFKLKKEGNPNVLSVPVHGGKTLKKGLVFGLLRCAGMTREEFQKHYR
jgi:predicted RNA binding protein YcfA (HicA-like mRNA interferase family)